MKNEIYGGKLVHHRGFAGGAGMRHLCRVSLPEAAGKGAGREGQGVALVGGDERGKRIGRRYGQAEAAAGV